MRIKYQKKSIYKNKIWVTLFVLLAIIISIQLIMSNMYAGKGARLANLEKEALKLTSQNQLISQELANNSSFMTLSKDALEAGFVKPEKFLYLDSSTPVAQLQ